MSTRTQQSQIIEKLSEREHILRRPSMYIGAVSKGEYTQWIYNAGQLEYKQVQYVPGLVKIINEIIDNSIDEYVKTSGEFANKLSVHIDSNSIQVQDNGRGIPVEKNADGIYIPNLCFLHARAGSNFDDDNNVAQIGTNGVGSFATCVFSSKFIAETDDGKKAFKLHVTDNASKFKETVHDSKNRGTKVTFYPDLERFGLESIDEIHMNIIRTRLMNLAMSYPDIDIKFNSKKMYMNKKIFLKMFGENYEVLEKDDYFFAIFPNPEDDFRQFSYINGLNISGGGTHIDLICANVVNRMRDVLIKKYKSIKPADIRNKLLIVFLGKNFKNLRFDSQTKEKITNSMSETSEFFGGASNDVDWDVFSKKLLRNKLIVDPITEVYRIKEEFKRRQELQNLNKVQKKIKSDKYLPSIGDKKYLVLCEGFSALSALSPILGRKEFGYYELRGKPLNSYSSDQVRFTQNKELSELFQIIKNENYKYVVFANDNDLDGIHIAGLLLGFFLKYLGGMKGQIARFATPIKFAKKNGKPTKWVYSLSEDLNISNGEEFKYMKGLGSWRVDDLKYIIEKDGLSKMIDVFDFDNDEMIDDWLSSEKSDKRKEYISANIFDIAKI